MASLLDDVNELLKLKLDENLTENDWVEEYWKQHPDEDPCNDPTARAFGLCK
jgi:hypothetical protein